MMASAWDATRKAPDPALTVDQQLELIRREREELERRVALIESYIDAIRSQAQYDGADAR